MENLLALAGITLLALGFGLGSAALLLLGAAVVGALLIRSARRRRGPGLAWVLAGGVLVASCGSGTVHTSTGADVATSTVVTQDVVGDVLNALTQAQAQAVAVHDHTPICAAAGTPTVPTCDQPAVHAARSKTLHTTAAGLRTGWNGLTTWKLAASGTPPVGIFCEFGKDVPDLVNLAVQLGVLKQDAASKALSLASALVAGGCS